MTECRGADPREIAEEAGGGGTLERIVTDAVNDHVAPIRRRRAEFARDPAPVSALLPDGNLRAAATAEATLAQAREVMGTVY
ncbi:hypothetical protein [Amycolatopsis sp. NPDC051903]|uniref:hypothetical protein n=1 Tax=Amycolatopsis sp. NPDC051903 TaxID=3363936 RepID=UPI003791EC78